MATWNLRAFGGLTERWRAEDGESPLRDLFDVRCIAEVVSRFDVAALQEVRGNLTALRTLLAALGPDWAAVMTDVTRGHAEELAVPDLEPVTLSEVGTKLDLARAYVDMGDPDGARNILNEVLSEGSASQKQEAQRLIESLPG